MSTLVFGKNSNGIKQVLPIISGESVNETDSAVSVTAKPQNVWSCAFAKFLASGVDTDYFSVLQTGSGQTVGQYAGNLNINTGTTANSETIIRSARSWMDAFSLRWTAALSQRIANQNFIVELVDIIGDNLPITAMGVTTTHAFTWTRSTTTATITMAGHGLATGSAFNVTVSSDTGAITTGAKTVLAFTDNNTFTLTCLNAGATSGTGTYTTAFGVTATVAGFDGTNVGQSMYMGAISLVGGSSPVIVPQRVPISDVSGNSVTFVSVGQSGTLGTGTCSLFGWNYHHFIYSGTNATLATCDSQKKGWCIGDGSISTTTSAAPGHCGIITQEDGLVGFLDAIVTSSSTRQGTSRASRLANIPDPNVPLYIQLRLVNGPTSPASTTTWSVGMVRMESFASMPVAIQSAKVAGPSSSMGVVPGDGSSFAANVSMVSGVNMANCNPGKATGQNGFTMGLGAPSVNLDYSAQDWKAASGSGATIASANGAATGYDVSLTSWSAGSSTGLVAVLQESLDNSTGVWSDIWVCETLTATGHARIPAIPIGGLRRMRWVQLNGSAATTCTVTVTATQSNISWARQFQYYDRTASVTSGTAGLGNGTAYIVEGCRNFLATIKTGTATAPASYKLQMSLNNADWYDASAATSCPASSVTIIPVTAGVYGKFSRFVCTVAGTTALVTEGSIYAFA